MTPEQKRRILVARAASRSLATLQVVDAEIGGDEHLREAMARLGEHLATAPQYVKDDLLRYFGPHGPTELRMARAMRRL